MKTEAGRKFILAGHLGVRCSSATMCTVSIAQPLPLRRMISFHAAFMHKNGVLIREMVKVAERRALKLLSSGEKENPNVQHFLTTPVNEWFLNCAELCVSNPTPEHSSILEAAASGAGSSPHGAKRAKKGGLRQGAGRKAGGSFDAAALRQKKRSAGAASSHQQDPGVASSPQVPEVAAVGWWAEPEHTDGGASILHMGVTLYGSRRLRCVQGDGEKDVEMLNQPGSVYLGPLTGPVHQVHHQLGLDGGALQIDGFGPCSITVMMRTALFPACQSRLKNTTPAPPPFFEILAQTFREGLVAGVWQLPSLAECEAYASD